MKTIFSNLNWLFILLALTALVVGFFYLPPFWILINSALLIALAYLSSIKNISLAKKEKIFSQRENQLNSILNSLREGVIVYDQNFKILIWNAAAEQIFGLKAQDVVGEFFTLKVRQNSSNRPIRLLLTILFPALAPMIIRRSEPGVFPQIADFSFDEPELELRVYTNRVLDPDGNVTGYVKLIHDRTRELNLLRLKSEFIAIASHQLQTPLTAVSWAMEGLKKEPSSLAQQTLIAQASGAVNQLLKIVTDLLDVSKIEEGRFGYEFQEIELGSFLNGVLEQTKPVADKYKVKLYFEKPAEAIKVSADPLKLGIAVKNLLENGIKYNIPNGDVAMKLVKYPNAPYVEVSVRDTGIGIPAEVADKIFSKFFRAENAAKIAVEGTGLGLYITKNIVKRHGGKIWFKSTLNRGATFSFTLPTNPTLIPAKEIIYEE